MKTEKVTGKRGTEKKSLLESQALKKIIRG
jgi:hypothetical protein